MESEGLRDCLCFNSGKMVCSYVESTTLYSQSNNYLYAHAADGEIYSEEIGGIVMENNEHTFKYLPSENGDTLWPSMSY